MKHVFWKFFHVAQYEQEEAWLNEMSAKGLQLAKVGLFRYVFTEGEPGEYVYRLELLGDRPGGAKGLAYIGFLRDMGVECIGTILYWAYFRKKNDGAPFEIYSDRGSRLMHFERILTLCKAVIALNAAAFGVNALACIMQPALAPLNASCAGLSLFVTLCVSLYSGPLRKRVLQLRREAALIE